MTSTFSAHGVVLAMAVVAPFELKTVGAYMCCSYNSHICVSTQHMLCSTSLPWPCCVSVSGCMQAASFLAIKNEPEGEDGQHEQQLVVHGHDKAEAAGYLCPSCVQHAGDACPLDLLQLHAALLADLKPRRPRSAADIFAAELTRRVSAMLWCLACCGVPLYPTSFEFGVSMMWCPAAAALRQARELLHVLRSWWGLQAGTHSHKASNLQAAAAGWAYSIVMRA